jgi:hypothetical protein
LKTIQHSFFPDNQCEEHGILDTFPCPWPDCHNGIQDNGFYLDLLIEGKKPDIYERKEWMSSDGDKYYSWGKKDWPSWFTCKKTFWAEARRKKLITPAPPEILYHYTSIEGLMGILESRSIWLSDYQYLNDRREINHGADIIREVARKMLKKSNDKLVSKLLEAWIVNLDNIEDRIFIASFSADGDSLSQWRAYGTVALGFKVSDIAVHVNDIYIQSVEYNEEVQRNLAVTYLNHLCQAYKEDSSLNLIERSPDIYHRIIQLVELISSYKDASFMDERECRVIYIEDLDVIESLDLDRPPKKYRANNSHIIPYVSSDSIYPMKGHERPLEISEIVLGPSCDDLLEKGVKEYVSELGFNEIPIKRSKVPYRT